MEDGREADCNFCSIASGGAPASIVYEDEIVLAIMDINPVNVGHLLVLPRRHMTAVEDMDEATGMRLFGITTRLARALRRSGMPCEGINLFLADGEAAFQEVPHVHMHVFPRFKGDSFRISAEWSTRPSRAELDTIAAQIRHVDLAIRGNREATA